MIKIETLPHVDMALVFEAQYPAKIHFCGEIPTCQENGDVHRIWSAVAELINNCVENKSPGDNSIGAKNVWINFEEDKVTVKDDFVYDNPRKVLNRIISIRNSKKPKTTKVDHNGNPEPGGYGVLIAMGIFESFGGNLKYHIENDSIVAVGTWNPKLLKPKVTSN